MELDWILLSTKKNTLTRLSKDLLSLTVWQKKNRKLLKPVGNKPGAMNGSCKAHKASPKNYFVGPVPPYLQICKILSANLRLLTTNEFTEKVIVDQ